MTVIKGGESYWRVIFPLIDRRLEFCGRGPTLSEAVTNAISTAISTFGGKNQAVIEEEEVAEVLDEVEERVEQGGHEQVDQDEDDEEFEIEDDDFDDEYDN